jgi:hypothetical protein
MAVFTGSASPDCGKKCFAPTLNAAKSHNGCFMVMQFDSHFGRERPGDSSNKDSRFSARALMR